MYLTTISTYQRQTLYDLASKIFEEMRTLPGCFVSPACAARLGNVITATLVCVSEGVLFSCQNPEESGGGGGGGGGEGGGSSDEVVLLAVVAVAVVRKRAKSLLKSRY